MKIKSKVALLKEIGIVAPRILRKVDEPRNSLEHSYKDPTIQEVEDALDIAALFIEATNRSINPIRSWFNMVNSDEYDKSADRFPNEFDGFRGISQEVVGRRG